jgi:hypothetical protein
LKKPAQLSAVVGVGLLIGLLSATPVFAAPPGNNGTVKIDGIDFDNHPNNEPHVGCSFQIDFTGFDASQPVTASLVGHPPTGGGLLATESTTLDGAGAGSITLDLSGTLGGITPHPRQGFHIKLTVDTGQGAGKHKVFWVMCGPQGSAEFAPAGGERIEGNTPGTLEGALTAFQDNGSPMLTGAGVAALALAGVTFLGLRKLLLARIAKADS